MQNKPTFHVHFVCTGNIYRSRLAEAYLKSKLLPHIQATSSGTQAKIQHKGPIAWYALRLFIRNQLIPFMKQSWTQTTASQFKDVDKVIFMGRDNYQYCLENKFLGNIPYAIWDLPDFDDSALNLKPYSAKMEVKFIEQSEIMFSDLKHKVDDLLIEIALVKK